MFQVGNNVLTVTANDLSPMARDYGVYLLSTCFGLNPILDSFFEINPTRSNPFFHPEGANPTWLNSKIGSEYKLCDTKMADFQETRKGRFFWRCFSSFNSFLILGSAENEYVMKCIMRTFSCLQGAVIPFLATLLPVLTQKLQQAAKNPTKPHFNHYIFETFCLAIRIVCTSQPGAVSNFEGKIFRYPDLNFIQKNFLTENFSWKFV